MEQVAGIEPASTEWKSVILAIIRYLQMESVRGIEPLPKPWQDFVLPLNYTGIYERNKLHHFILGFILAYSSILCAIYYPTSAVSDQLYNLPFYNILF